jgi:hypothetical protein
MNADGPEVFSFTRFKISVSDKKPCPKVSPGVSEDSALAFLTGEALEGGWVTPVRASSPKRAPQIKP